jgi:Papain-like cysteine protease AvrRpt2
MNDLLAGDPAVINTPLNAFEKRNPRERDEQLSGRLVDYLNEHIEYFHRCIWCCMDANRRFLLLDGFIAPDAGGRSVASVVENRVIGVVGNSLVMPVAPGQQLDNTYEFANVDAADLRNLYDGDPAPPIRISVPTSGVFAEAVMGKCNSCEVIDDTKFWRWEDAPIPDQPPMIGALSTNSRRSDSPNLSPDPFPDAIIGLQQTPESSDPTGLAAAVKALGVNNIFKDLTGVAKNQANAAAALKSSMEAAKTFASQAGALAQQKYLNNEIDRTLAQIKSAKDKKLITSDQAQHLTETALRGAIGAKKKKEEKPTDSAEVQKNLNRMQKAKKGKMRVTTPNGTTEVSIDNSGGSPRINAAVDPVVGFVQQSDTMTCWAAGATMMVGWKNRQSITIDTVLSGLGGAWLAKMQHNDPLTAVEFRALMAAIGAVEEGPASYSTDGLARLLESKGPLLEIGDDAVESNMLIHVRVITAVTGDGTPEKTYVTLLDAMEGEMTIPFTTFDQRHGGSDVVESGLGIFHF